MKKHSKILFYIALSILLYQVSIAGESIANNFSQLPLEQFLNPDGTLNLNTGYSGAIDPNGWQMEQDVNGQPRFVQLSKSSGYDASRTLMADGDENWDDQFALPGTDLEVYALASNETTVYIGGCFYSAGNIRTNFIAKWDGAVWSDLGGGTGSEVYAIAVNGDDVYVGGHFIRVGEIDACCIAKWDGNQWHALTNNISSLRAPIIRTICVNGNDIYVGGNIDQIEGVEVQNIAKWDGNTWSALGEGVSGDVYAIAANGNEIYVGGDFDQAGGMNAEKIAMWDGDQWHAMDDGVSGVSYSCVNAISIDGSDVYIGGRFSFAGSISANNIAKWDGNNWYALGLGTSGTVNSIKARQGKLYVGGHFTQAGGLNTEKIAMWDGTSWIIMNSMQNDRLSVNDIAICGVDIYIGGSFTFVEDIHATNIAKWDGQSWSSLWEGKGLYHCNIISAQVFSMASSGNDVYVGGSFTMAGKIMASNIAKWNGKDWFALGSGLDYYVYAIDINGQTGDVYAGGFFRKAGELDVGHIAKWDGNNWSSLGGGVSNYVFAIDVDEQTGDVYAGGFFSSAGGLNANGIARWDGNNWYNLGSGVVNEPYGFPMVFSICVFENNVYAGGRFNYAGGIPANNIAKWDGNQWSSLGSGINWSSPYVYAIETDGNDIYVAGQFSLAGNIDVNNIARWDGSNWYALGNGLLPCWDLSVTQNYIYANGNIDLGGGNILNGPAKWDGNSWSSLGSGTLCNRFSSVEVSDDYVYVGGCFTAGGKVSLGFGRYYNSDLMNTPIGTNVEVQLDNNVTITFETVSTAGQTEVTETIEGPPPSSIYKITPLGAPIYYDFTTTAEYSGIITIQLPYDESEIRGTPEQDLKLFHYEGATPIDITIEVDTENNLIFGETTSLSLFAIAILKSPIEAIESMITEINNLQFEQGFENSLVSKLDNTVKSLEKENYIAAVAQLNALINQIEAQTGKKILEPDADKIITSVQSIIDSIQKNLLKEKQENLKLKTAPQTFNLAQNIPNPFNPSTMIHFALPESRNVIVKIYNTYGQEVCQLTNQVYQAGYHKITWNGTDETGNMVSSGIYIYKITAGEFMGVKKMMLMR